MRTVQMRLLCVAWLWLLALPVLAQTRAWLDRAEITEGETAVLNIATSQSIDQIDFSPLRARFEIGGQSVRRSFELDNGRASRTSVFSVGLRPRAAGVIPLPPLRVGRDLTAPLRLIVLAATVQPASADADIFIETDVDAVQPYVQQAVGVTVKLHYAIPLLSGQLDQEAPAQGSLQRVGEDITYQRLLGGRRYSVVERRYLLIPERSGPLLLPGARLNGISGGGLVGAMFDGERRPVSAAAPASQLQVLPIPAAAPQPWLPLRSLVLRYLQAPAQAWTGAAATVEIEAIADGASAAQMPAIDLPAVAGVQVFPEPAQVEEAFVAGRPRTTLRRKFALVPTRVGSLQLPGPTIRWWDALQRRAQVAALPPLRLPVAQGRQGAAAAAPPPVVAEPEADAPDALRVAKGTAGDRKSPWLPALAVLPALLLLAWWWHRRRPQAAARRESITPVNPVAEMGLPQALAGNDLGRIARALACAAGLAGEDLEAVGARLADPAQLRAVQQLQAARWGDGDAGAALAALRAAFAGGARWRKTKQKAESLLPPLYPE